MKQAKETRIISDPKILGGKPVISGTRISVEFVLELLSSNWSYNRITKDYQIKKRDIIAAIDGEDTAGISLNYAVSQIRGQGGTEVVLTIFRESNNELKEVPIVREAITVKSLNWEFKGNDITAVKRNGMILSVIRKIKA